MGRYRRIDVRIWNDEKVRAFDFFAQDVWSYILTNPQTNQIGLYVYRHEFALSDLLPRWESAARLFAEFARENGQVVSYEVLVGTDSSNLRSAYHRAWDALAKGSMIFYHKPSRVLFVTNFLRYEPPHSHLNVLGWQDILAELPTGHGFFPQLRNSLALAVGDNKREECLQALDQALVKGISKPSPPDPPRQEQEQEQEQDKEKTPPTPSKSKGKRFQPPTLEEVKSYCQERKNSVDPERWMDHYLSNGWKVGQAKNPMKDWKAAVRTWERNEPPGATTRNAPSSPPPPFVPRSTKKR